MNDPLSRMRKRKPRVKLTPRIRAAFQERLSATTISALARETGIPYIRVYNIMKNRVASVSERHYRLLMRDTPPRQKPVRIDATVFRRLVRLWRFLNPEVSKADLFRELQGHRAYKKVDYRLFNGQVATVAPRFEAIMRSKFHAAGIDDATVAEWVDELDGKEVAADRVPYAKIRPLLLFLKHAVGIRPTPLLNQSFERYERGELMTVARSVYERAQALHREAKSALRSGDRLTLLRMRERVVGPSPRHTIFLEILPELQFLRRQAKRGVKRYLQRGIRPYLKGDLKRIATWRADWIRNDCDDFVKRATHLRIGDLPPRHRRQQLTPLEGLLVARAAQLLSRKEGLGVEKRILAPSRASAEYRDHIHGFTRFERASSALGMKPKAFDLMVATNCEIFRSVGTYTREWYLSNLYLRELTQKALFGMVMAKYEMMARNLNKAKQIEACRWQSGPSG
ncbi:MAG: hypothetical protein QNJ22_06315 [Desulfosarcinaceae bacterium]|nr:hypothetical protein [Desulfosarcinaceae bacterium]